MPRSASNKWMVFSDDWGRHPSSCQHLVRHLVREVDVTWVNTIGMRPPRLDLITARRGWGKLRGWLTREKHSQPGDDATTVEVPTVVDAKMWPWMSHSWDRWLNRELMARQLRELIRGATVVSTIPIVADLVDRLPAARWVYYCVDDFSSWPGMHQRAMLDMEERLISKVDSIITVSDVLKERVSRLGRDSNLLTHGTDLDHWALDQVVPHAWPDSITGPVALFWGVVDQRLDVGFVNNLSERLKHGSVVLVGPSQSPDPLLAQLPNVHILDPVDYSVLPRLARAADCLVMPYINAPVTQAMQPLKLKEYLATGRPVVARQLPSTEPWKDCLDLVATQEAFAEAVSDRIRNGVCDSQLASRQRLDEESWSAKSQHFLELVQG